MKNFFIGKKSCASATSSIEIDGISETLMLSLDFSLVWLFSRIRTASEMRFLKLYVI